MRYGQHSYSLAQLRKFGSQFRKQGERDYTRADDGKFSETSGGGGSKQDKPKEEPKGEASAAEPASTEERTTALGDAGLDPATAEAFDELAVGIADGEDIALNPEAKQKLIEAGLVTPREGSDWAVDLTDKGKAVAEAAMKGDGAAAKTAMEGGATDTPKPEAAKPADKPQAALSTTKPGEKPGEKPEKPKGGGGGSASEEPEDKAKAEAQAKVTAEAANKASFRTAELDGMRAAADGGVPDPKVAAALIEAGLMETTPDGPQLTAAGRQALNSLERGDARGAVAARQSAKTKQRQNAERTKAKADKDRVQADKERDRQQVANARAAREREMLSPWLKSFMPFAEADAALLHKFAGDEPDAEAHIVYGIASTAIVDDQPGVWEGQRYDGDMVDPAGMAEAIRDYWGNIRAMHDDGVEAVGTAIDVFTADDGRTYLIAKVIDPDAWQKVRERVYKGFSIGGRVLKAILKRLPDGRVIRRILKLLLTEISLVDRPANPEAAILVFKRSVMNDDTKKDQPASGPLAELETLAKAGGDPKKVVMQIQALRNEAELAGDLEGAERYTQAIGLMLVGAGEADDPMAEAEEEVSADVEMAADPPAETEEDELTMGAGAVQMAAGAQVRKVGRKIAGGRMKVMKDAVMAYLKVLADAGDGDSAAMLKVVQGGDVAAPAFDTKAITTEITKALNAPFETIAKAVLQLHQDIEIIKAQPMPGGPVGRFAGQPVTKRLGAAPPATETATPPDTSQIARLKQLIATETRPSLITQYQDQLKAMGGA